MRNWIRRAYTAAVLAEAAYQLVVYAGDEVQTFDLPGQGAVTIGRGEGSAVRIDDPSVSRNHAVLHLGPQLVIEDLGGPNGTMVRDRAGGGGAGETLNVRQLHGRKADLGVGESILFGTASVVVRHAPTVELPELATGDRGVIVRDPAMKALYEQAAHAARSPLSVLVLGETGVGKEVLAHAIHAHSPRSKGPFLGINCAALSESILESELFGHEKGAFTGAQQARVGLFESANTGTVFLDEIGDLSPSTQVKLLRVLEEREVTRLGANRPRSIDVRFVAATHRDLEAEFRTGRFRQDLFFRLNGISLLIPPLRERPSEIEPFARMFLAAACRQVERKKPPVFSPSTLVLLEKHGWPGNVRELRSAVERAAALCLGDTILPEHLPPSLLKAAEPRTAPATVAAPTPKPAVASASSSGIDQRPPDLQSEVDSLERVRIVQALELYGGNQTRAALKLGISRGTLVSRMAAFGLPRPRKRDTDE